MWYDKNNNYTVFMDKRHEITTFCQQTISILPDVQAVWAFIPFKSETFDMIIFDPPHIISPPGTAPSGMQRKYGVLYTGSWMNTISTGMDEMFRVLKPGGILIFKWNDARIKLSEVLKCIHHKPAFGTRTGTRNNTHWITFIKSVQ